MIMKNTQRGFIVPLVIAIIALLAVGGGVYVYTKNHSTNTAATTTPQVASLKTYTNSKYGFQFKYPQEFLPDEQDDSTFEMILRSKKSGGFIVVRYGKSDNVKISGSIYPATSKAEVVSNKGTETINSNSWSKFNFDSIPQEGRGTAGSEVTYYTIKGDSTVVVQCENCSEETFGEEASSTRAAFNQILSTFTFTASSQSNITTNIQTGKITADAAVTLVSNLPEVKDYMKKISISNNLPENKGHIFKEGKVEVDSTTEDSYVVWVYEWIGYEMPEGDHAVTFARYDVNASTGKITKEKRL
jgi:hypothetical protein